MTAWAAQGCRSLRRQLIVILLVLITCGTLYINIVHLRLLLCRERRKEIEEGVRDEARRKLKKTEPRITEEKKADEERKTFEKMETRNTKEKKEDEGREGISEFKKTESSTTKEENEIDNTGSESELHRTHEWENFEDGYFAPILDAFRKQARENNTRQRKLRFRSAVAPKAFVYVDPIFVRNRWLSSYFYDIQHNLCPLPCAITTNITQLRTCDAVLVHLRSVVSREQLLKDLGPRDPSQPWVMFEPETHLQANALYHAPYHTLNGIFNRTFHHRRDSDVLILHGFVVRRGHDADLLPQSWRREPKSSPAVARNKLAVAFISNCRDNSGRLDYIKSLQKLVPVDVYGECGSLQCGSSRYVEQQYRADTDSCMKMVASRYLFFLAFENALCRDYVTEKPYNLLFYVMVPVVLGAADYTQLLPPHSYIDASHYTPQQLARRLTHLAAHPQVRDIKVSILGG